MDLRGVLRGEENIVTASMTERPATVGKGRAEFHATWSQGEVVGVRNTILESSHPVRLLVPPCASTSRLCQWLYVVTQGGGLSEGQDVVLEVTVGRRCTVVVTTQSFTRVLQCDRLGCRQTLQCTVEDGALLAHLPDPAVCYRGAALQKEQEYHLAEDASLVAVDWLTAGRVALGERWEMKSYRSTTNVYVRDKLVCNNATALGNCSPHITQKTMGLHDVIGTCVVIGPATVEVFKRILRGDFNGSHKEIAIKATPIRKDKKSEEVIGANVTFLAENAQQIYGLLRDLLQDLVPVLGGDPFWDR